MKFETLRHCCIHSHAKPCENISGQGGGERKSGVAKQRARPGQGGGKRADNADKQDRQTDRQTRARLGQGGAAYKLRQGGKESTRRGHSKEATAFASVARGRKGGKRRTQSWQAWLETGFASAAMG